MSNRLPLLPVFAAAALAASALHAGAQTSTVSFDTTFEVTDAINGSATGLSGGDNLPIDFDSDRGPFDDTVFLPQFDSTLGQLTSVNLEVDFDRSEVSLPITLTDATGGARTASIDVLSVRRGFVFGVATGFPRPLVIESTIQTVGLDVLEPNGLLTVESPTSVQLTIPTTGPGSFTPIDDIVTFPTLTEGELSFSFTGTGDFGFVFRRLAEIEIGLDQDGFDLEVDGGVIEYAGTVAVTYTFTPVPEPASLVLLSAGGLMLTMRRRRGA